MAETTGTDATELSDEFFNIVSPLSGPRAPYNRTLPAALIVPLTFRQAEFYNDYN